MNAESSSPSAMRPFSSASKKRARSERKSDWAPRPEANALSGREPFSPPHALPASATEAPDKSRANAVELGEKG